jgi:hypothetical protein
MSKLIGGTLTVLLVIVLAVLFVGSATIRFNLITVQPAFFQTYCVQSFPIVCF